MIVCMIVSGIESSRLRAQNVEVRTKVRIGGVLRRNEMMDDEYFLMGAVERCKKLARAEQSKSEQP